MTEPSASQPARARTGPGAREREREILMPHEAAAMFGVTEKTLARWASTGTLPSSRTLGGHRRYRRSDVEALLAQAPHPSAIVPADAQPDPDPDPDPRAA